MKYLREEFVYKQLSSKSTIGNELFHHIEEKIKIWKYVVLDCMKKSKKPQKNCDVYNN